MYVQCPGFRVQEFGFVVSVKVLGVCSSMRCRVSEQFIISLCLNDLFGLR